MRQNRIVRTLRALAQKRQKALSVYLTAGCPSLRASEAMILSLAASGVDFFEIGLPFSDPVADGPVIQKSSELALKKGTTWKGVMALAARIRRRSQVPLILMSYANPLFSRGWERSVRELHAAGFDGIIVPDLTPEEGGDLAACCKRRDLAVIYLAAPTTAPSRIKRIARASSGFLYAVSITGVTGARKALPEREIRSFLGRLRRASRLPVLLGFGISQPEQTRRLKDSADGFIVGSAMMKILQEKRPLPALIGRAKSFIIPFVRGSHDQNQS